MTKTTKKILLRYVLAPIVMIVFLWIIYRQLEAKGDLPTQWNHLQQYWHEANNWGIVLILSLSVLNWLWEAIKWQRTIQYLYPVSLWVSFRAIITGIAFGMVTPGKLGDFAGRILYVPPPKRLKATVATFMTNFIQVVASTCLGIIGLVAFIYYYDTNAWLNNVLIILTCLISVALLMFITRQWWLPYFLQLEWIQKTKRILRVLNRYDKKDIRFIFFFSLVKFLTYNIQFLVLANLLGAQTPWLTGIFATMMMYWLLMAIPSFMLADVSIRGFMATMIFIETGLTKNGLSLLTASYITWLLNLVLPAIAGSFLMLGVRYKNSKAKQYE